MVAAYQAEGEEREKGRGDKKGDGGKIYTSGREGRELTGRRERQGKDGLKEKKMEKPVPEWD